MNEILEIKAGDTAVKVPNTPEGRVVFQATLKLLEVVFAEEEGEPIEPTHSAKEKEKKKGPQPTPVFSLPVESPKQRIKFKGWEPLATSKAGRIYKEVVNRLLEEYKEGVEPKQGIIPNIIREMYGENLSNASVASYASVYKRYIKENKLAEKLSVKGENNLRILEEEKAVKTSSMVHTANAKEPIPIHKVAEIWNALPMEFTYKQVKAHVPVSISQTAPRIDATNFIIKQFLDLPMFKCEETSPGVFKKRNGEI